MKGLVLMVESTLDFYLQTRTLFPDLTERADREHVKYWGESPDAIADSYIWFNAVASALNNAMCQGAYVQESRAFFVYVITVLAQCGEPVRTCIDVSLVENLFWQVSPTKAGPYWAVLPSQLQNLYLGFHRDAPV